MQLNVVFRTEVIDPEGVCTRYEYDILDRRNRIFNDDGLEVLYGYDALNRISNIHYGNGVETAYTYDGNGNHTAKTGTQATLGDIISGSNALDLSYAYDVRGQLLEERRNGASVCYA